MKLIDYEGLRERGIRYSKPHLWRMWTAGQFPRPLKLTPCKNAWTVGEIDAWIEARVAARDGRGEAA
jgi:prophage regulatory protein